MAKIFFNRLHLNIQDKRPKKPFIFDGIRSAAAAGYNDYSYKIIGVETFGSYIKGYLIKYDPYGKGEILDESTAMLRSGGTVNSIIAKSLFLINTSDMIIAFEEINNQISRTMFVRMFSEIFRINNENQIFEFSVSSISEKYSFIERVSNLKNINRISITLVPSNPSNADLWRRYDESLKTNRITKYREIQESNDLGGIIVNEDTKAKMAMSEDGYGVTIATGTDDRNNPTIITTKSRNQEITQDLPKKILQNGMPSVIEYLERTFESIRIRTEHQE